MLENIKEQITAISNVIKNTYKSYMYPILIVVVCAVGYEGFNFYNRHLKKQETILQQQNDTYKKQIADLTTENNKLAKAKADADAEVVKLQTAVDIAEQKANSDVVPPKPVVPTDEKQIISDLKQDGVEFTPLQGTIFSTDHTSLPIIWNWDKQAARVPALEIKLADTSNALQASNSLVSGLNQEKVISDKMIEDADKRENLRKLQVDNLNKQIENKDKQILVADVNGYLKIGVTAVLFFEIGKHLK